MAAPEFVASQLDWAALQESHRELWLECARRAFEGLAADADGRLRVEALIGALRGKLPAAEVDYAVEDALVEAGYAGGRLLLLFFVPPTRVCWCVLFLLLCFLGRVPEPGARQRCASGTASAARLGGARRPDPGCRAAIGAGTRGPFPWFCGASRSLHSEASVAAPPPLYPDADEVDFEGFLRMLRVGSYDSLDALDQVGGADRGTAVPRPSWCRAWSVAAQRRGRAWRGRGAHQCRELLRLPSPRPWPPRSTTRGTAAVCMGGAAWRGRPASWRATWTRCLRRRRRGRRLESSSSGGSAACGVLRARPPLHAAQGVPWQHVSQCTCKHQRLHSC